MDLVRHIGQLNGRFLGVSSQFAIVNKLVNLAESLIIFRVTSIPKGDFREKHD